MRKSLTKLLSVAFGAVLAVGVCFGAACNRKNSLNPEERSLVLQTSTMDGVFNPFLVTNGYDQEVIGYIFAGLLSNDPDGSLVADNEHASVAESYEIYYTDDLQTFEKKNAYEEGDYVVYDFILKKGAKFSNGAAITADDVLFNMYTYIDPAYDGGGTMYTVPILGLEEYRYQSANASEVIKEIEAILAAGEGATSVSGVDQAKVNFYWSELDKTKVPFAQSIIDYVAANYLTDEYVKSVFGESYTADMINTDSLKTAYALNMWGFSNGAVSDGKITGVSGKQYDVNSITVQNYWDEIEFKYTGDNGKVDYSTLDSTEGIGYSMLSKAQDAYFAEYSATVLGNVKSVSGLSKFEKDGKEGVRVVLTKQDPKAILQFSFAVASKDYYTAGFDYDSMQKEVVNYGVPLGKAADLTTDSKFLDHIETYNNSPLGAGPYVFKSYSNQTVQLERNTYFDTMGGDNITNAKIKNVTIRGMELGGELDALKAKEIDYGNVDANSSNMAEIGKNKNLTSITVANLGYGYIGLNAALIPNLHERIALTTLFNLDKVYEYYPDGLAQVIYRSQTTVSWAYPENATAMYAYDETKAAAVEQFKLAGFAYDEASGKFTAGKNGAALPEYVLTLPSDAASHPAGGIFLQAADLLQELGFTARVETDLQLIANVNAGTVAIYALAWSSTPDPDMYQVYHYASQANSVISNGIKYMYEGIKGVDFGDDYGTVTFTPKYTLEGVTEANEEGTFNQKELITYLGYLIEEGTRYMTLDARKPIYEEALDVLARIDVEVPTYQRNNMFVYNNEVIDATTLYGTPSAYCGPLFEIWNVNYVK